MGAFADKNRLKNISWAIVVGLFSALVFAAFQYFGLTKNWEMRAYDLRMQFGAKYRPKPQNVIMFYVDEGSLRYMQSQGLNWPWPRELQGSVMDFCRRGGARAVIYDLFYSEDSVYGIADDEAFAAWLASGVKSYLVLFLSNAESVSDPRIPLILQKGTVPFRGAIPSWVGRERSIASLPIAPLAATASGFGNAQVPPDDDGIFRRVAPLEEFGGSLIPAVPLKVAGDVLGAGEMSWPKKTIFKFGSTNIPLDDDGKMMINYYGGTDTFPSYPLAEVLVSEAAIQQGTQPQIDPNVVKDKVVIVGLAAPGLYDLKPTPLARVFPGPEVHATAIENLLTKDFITPVDRNINLAVTFACGIVAALGLALISSTWGFGVWIILLACALACSGIFLFVRGVWFELVPPFGVLVVSSFGMILKNYLVEGRKKRAIKRAFGQYLSPHVVGEIAKNPGVLKLGGVEQELSLFFSDIADFTTISEKMPPSELVSRLNSYFSETTKIIQKNCGTLDKYIGDAIMAFWGAPLFVADHAMRAVCAALDIQTSLNRLGFFPSRIGIHTGKVIVGNIGSDIRFNYTVIGDAVNLASRLEGLNKKFGTSIVISEPAYRATNGAVEARKIGRVRVKGRQEPVGLYEPLGLKGNWGYLSAEYCGEFSNALGYYENGRFAEALLKFKKLSHSMADPVSARYISVCEKFINEAPADFDGVTTFTTK